MLLILKAPFDQDLYAESAHTFRITFDMELNCD